MVDSPDGGQSPLRRLRIPNTTWNPAYARAEREGTSIGAVNRELLRLYATGELDVEVTE